MGRLIDAWLVLDNLSGRLESMKDYDAVKDAINNMPTVYDADKVVEQLEEYGNEEMDYYRNTPYEKCIEECVHKAIEIVKGGGVNGKEQS